MKNLNLVSKHDMYNSLRRPTYLAFPSHLLLRELLTKHLLCTLTSALCRQAGPYSQCARSAQQTHNRPLLSRTRDCTASGTVAVDEDQALGRCLRAIGWQYSLMEGWKGQSSKHMECHCWETGHGRQSTARTKDGPCHLLIEGPSQKPQPMCHIQKTRILRSFYTSLYQSF